MGLKRTKAWGNTIGYFASYIALGMMGAALGPTLPSLADNTQTQLSGISFLFTAHAFGYLIGSFQGGRLYDRMPGNPLMVGAMVVAAICLTLVPLIPVLWLLLIVVAILGIAGGVIDVGGNVLLVWEHGRQVGPYMNGLHFFFGLGAFIMPLLVSVSLSTSGDVNWAYWALAFTMLPVAVWLVRVASPSHPSAKAGPDNDEPATTQGGNTILIFLLAALFFLCVGAELGFGGWIYSYALALDLGTATTSAYLTSAFWGALTFGRALGIPIAMRLRPRSILLIDLVGCLVSVIIGLALPSSWIAILVSSIGLGLFMASVFPTIINLAERRMTITGSITAWFLIGSSLGSMTVPWLIGQLFERVGPQTMMVILVVDLAAALAVFAITMIYSARRVSLPSDLVYNSGSEGSH